MNYKFWYVLFFVLAVPPSVSSIYGIFKDKSVESISINITIPESFSFDSCLNKRNNTKCLEMIKSIENVKNEIKRVQSELENNISSSLRAYDKNIDILSFSLSLYAILITVVSLFFSFRESQRVDEGLNKMEDSLSKTTLEFDKLKITLNDRISTLDSTINARLLELNSSNVENPTNLEERFSAPVDELDHNQMDTTINTQDFSNK